MRNFFSKKHNGQPAQPKSSDQYKFWVPPSRVNAEPLRARNLSSGSQNPPVAVPQTPSHQIPPQYDTYPTSTIRSQRHPPSSSSTPVPPPAQATESVLNTQFWMPPQQQASSQSSHRYHSPSSKDKEEERTKDRHRSDRRRGTETDVERVQEKREVRRERRESSRRRDDNADRYRYYYSDTDRDHAQYKVSEKERRNESSARRPSSRRDPYEEGDSSDGSRRKLYTSSSHHRRYRSAEDYEPSIVPGTVPSAIGERPVRDDMPVHLPTKALRMRPTEDLPGSSSETERTTRHRETRHRRKEADPQHAGPSTKTSYSSRQTHSSKSRPEASSSRLTAVLELPSQSQDRRPAETSSSTNPHWNTSPTPASTSQNISSRTLEPSPQESSSLSSHYTTLSLSRPGAGGTPPTTSSESPSSLRKNQTVMTSPVEANPTSWYQPTPISEPRPRNPLSAPVEPKPPDHINAPPPVGKVPSLISKYESLATPALVVTPASPLPSNSMGWKPLAMDTASLAPPASQSRSKTQQTESRNVVVTSPSSDTPLQSSQFDAKESSLVYRTTNDDEQQQTIVASHHKDTDPIRRPSTAIPHERSPNSDSHRQPPPNVSHYRDADPIQRPSTTTPHDRSTNGDHQTRRQLPTAVPQPKDAETLRRPPTAASYDRSMNGDYQNYNHPQLPMLVSHPNDPEPIRRPPTTTPQHRTTNGDRQSHGQPPTVIRHPKDIDLDRRPPTNTPYERPTDVDYQNPSTTIPYASKRESTQVWGTSSRNEDRPVKGSSSYPAPVQPSVGPGRLSKAAASPLSPSASTGADQANLLQSTSRAPSMETTWASTSGRHQRATGPVLSDETLPSRHAVEPKWTSASNVQDVRYPTPSVEVTAPPIATSSSRHYLERPELKRGDSKSVGNEHAFNVPIPVPSTTTKYPTDQSRAPVVDAKGTSASIGQDLKSLTPSNAQAPSSAPKYTTVQLDGHSESKWNHASSYQSRYHTSGSAPGRQSSEQPRATILVEPKWTSASTSLQRQAASHTTKQQPYVEAVDNHIASHQDPAYSNSTQAVSRSGDTDRLPRQHQLENVDYARLDPSFQRTGTGNDRNQRAIAVPLGASPTVRPFQHPKLAELLSSAPSTTPSRSNETRTSQESFTQPTPRRDREVTYLSSASRQATERPENRPNVVTKPPSPVVQSLNHKSSASKTSPPSPGPVPTAASTPSSRQSPASLLRPHDIRAPIEPVSLRNAPSRDSYTSPRKYASPVPESAPARAQHPVTDPAVASVGYIPSQPFQVSSPTTTNAAMMYHLPQSPATTFQGNNRPPDMQRHAELSTKSFSQPSPLDYQPTTHHAAAWQQPVSISPALPDTQNSKQRPTSNYPPQSGYYTSARLSKETSQESILLTPSSLAPSMLKPTVSRSSVPASVSSQERRKKSVFLSMFKGRNHDPQSDNMKAEEPSVKLSSRSSKVPSAIAVPSSNVPISERKSPNKAVFTPFRYLTSRRKRTVSTASIEALNGTAANTVVGSPTASMHSQNPIQPPPLRDPIVAAQEWRDEMGSVRKIQRPGVVFDVKEDPSQDKQRLKPIKLRPSTSNRPN